ncbi:hypothetical protein [Actinomadura sp. NBRC 104425]|uniref:hypothetical protein n=1 Tax=Actinomadura sp. NBRC 104425 TaxID=3032204 RepID=UPI0025572477|nr:hypothetical protein [Actinomadura sp. NBRC 104425]
MPKMTLSSICRPVVAGAFMKAAVQWLGDLVVVREKLGGVGGVAPGVRMPGHVLYLMNDQEWRCAFASTPRRRIFRSQV